MYSDFPWDWSKKTSYQEMKIKSSKIAYTKLSNFLPSALSPSISAKKETRNWQIFICFRLLYMFGINKTTKLTEKTSTKVSGKLGNFDWQHRESAVGKSSFKFYHRWPYTTVENIKGDVPWHIFMALHCVYIHTVMLINNMYREIKTPLERTVVIVKEYGQIEAKSRCFYDPEWSSKKGQLVMFIIQHLFCAITCNKLIISVTLVLNYTSNDERAMLQEENSMRAGK